MINDKFKNMFINPTNKKFPSRPNHAAFSLLEMVVAIGIFSISIVILIQIFLATTKTQQKSIAVLKTQAEASYIMETINRYIRSGYVYYADDLPDSNLDGISDAQSELVLKDLNDNQIIFFRSDENCPGDVSNCLKMDFSGTVQYISGSGIEIESLEFYISPITDPFILDFNPGIGSQPKVTIAMAVKSIGSTPEKIATTFLQTTVSSRYYKR